MMIIPTELQKQISTLWCNQERKEPEPLAKSSPQKKYQVNLRLRAIEKLGGRCEKCGYDKIPALLVTRKTPRKEGWNKIYHAVLEGIPDYELLCLNCQREKEAGVGYGA
jgi:hypothetical protein